MVTKIFVFLFSALILITFCRKTEPELTEPNLTELKRFPIDGPVLLETSCESSVFPPLITTNRIRGDLSYDGHDSFWTYFNGPIGESLCKIFIGETGNLDVENLHLVVRAKIFIEKSVNNGSANLLLVIHYPESAPDKYDIEFSMPTLIRQPKGKWFTEQIETTLKNRNPDNIKIYLNIKGGGMGGGIGIDDVRVFKGATVEPTMNTEEQ